MKTAHKILFGNTEGIKRVGDLRESVRIIMIALMMEAARTSETSIDIDLRTRQYIPEDSELNTRRRENLESHNI
jgi:hypothetical protein